MTSFSDTVADLRAALSAEAASGARDRSLDANIEAARALYRTLEPGQRAACADDAQQLGAAVRARPAESDDEQWWAGLDASDVPHDDDDDPYAGVDLGDLSASGMSGPVFTGGYDGPLTADALRAYLGYADFRPGQRDAVQAALEGRDSLVVMPTGGGKSLCYQLPGVGTADLTIVVSPLIALMADQLRRLTDAGQPAVMVASGMNADEAQRSLRALRDGSARIVFCSPERFASQTFLRIISARRVGLFVIDEAHCLAEWGHDFRPDYLRLPGVIAQLGRPPVMAATATATEAVAAEITGRLGLTDPLMVRSGFDRPNITFDVVTLEGKGTLAAKRGLLTSILGERTQRPAIVYCGTRKDCESVAGDLSAAGIAAAPYHAGMDAAARATAQTRFMDGTTEAICATNAFGMGVDKANVRTVIHYALPTSVEAYYQEAGRAGRDGAPARALLLASRADLGRLVRFIKQREVDIADVQRFHARLARQATGGVLTLEPLTNDNDRLLLSLIERTGAATLAPAGAGKLQVTLTGTLSLPAVRAACKVSVDRGWQAYRAIEAYAFGSTCRRRTLLDHFGDTAPGAPDGRCCDVHAVDPALPDVAQLQSSASSRRTSSASAPVPEGDALYDALALWRREAADGKPAYTVATNAMLAAIAAAKPTNAADLGAIKGVGPSFLSKHSAEVLRLVATHR